MKLLVVTRESAEDRAYGLGKTLAPVLQYLELRGHQVEYYDKSACAEQHQAWQIKFGKILAPMLRHMAPSIAERLIQGISASSRAIQTHATHVWIHDPWLAIGLRIGLLRRGVMRRPFRLIISEHGLGSFAWAVTKDGLPIPSKLFRWFLKLERRILLAADAVFMPSLSAQQSLLRDLGMVTAPAHFSVMGYGKPELNLPTKGGAYRYLGLDVSALALSQSKCTDGGALPVVLAVGRIAPVKAFPLLIEALACLQHKYGIATQLVIAGGGDTQPLIDLADSLDVKPLPLIRFQPEISWSLAAADVYVSTCPVESYGQANREAMAAGVPVVAPSSGGSGEVLGDGACLLPMPEFEAGTADSHAVADRIARTLADMLTDPVIYQYWQNKARHECLSWPEWCELADLYEERLNVG